MSKISQIIIVVLFILIVFCIPVTQAVLEILDEETPHILSLFMQWPTEDGLRRFEEALEERSFAETGIRPFMAGALYRWGGDAGAKALKGRDGWMFYTPSMQYLAGPTYDDPRLVMPANGSPKSDYDPIACIVDFRDQLAERGIALLIVPVPAKLTVYPERGRDARFPGPLQLSVHTQRFLDSLRAHDVALIDLYSAFDDSKSLSDPVWMKDELYLDTDTHWSGRGIELAARVVSDRVKKSGWYAPELSGCEFSRIDTTVTRHGDIPMMTDIYNKREVFEKESMQVRQVVKASTGKRYEDDAGSPILLLGDSFSRIFQKDAPKEAGFIAQLAYELQMPIESIVNDGGASTLVREQLVRKQTVLDNKKLVIWEFAERDIRFGMKGWKKIQLKIENEE